VDLDAAALGGSSAMQAAFEQEALAAVPAQAERLAQKLRDAPPSAEAAAPVPPRFRCQECGVANVTWHWRCPSCRNWDSLRVNSRG
jgi:lipopolysaccharide biosynthesis regulator YciM